MNRGLDALFSDNSVPEEKKEAGQAQNGTAYVSISLVEPNKSQPRNQFDEEKIQELAQSIKENGILQPILVTPLENGGYRIVAGERRWRAARVAGLKEVPVFIRELNNKQVMQLALIENIQREDLTPIEEAMAYKQLMDVYSMTQQDVSQAVGKSRSVIANSLRLLTLGEPAMTLLEEGQLTVGHAKMLAGITDSKEQEECARIAAENKLTVRELEEYISIMANKDPQQSAKAKKPSMKRE